MRLLSKSVWLALALALALGLVLTSARTESHSQPAAPKRLPVPDKAAMEKSMKLIMDIFGEDFKTARDAVAMNKLADELLSQARDSKDDPANRYVLYKKARDLAAEAGNADLTLLAIDEMDRFFMVKALEMKAATLATVVEAKLGKDTAKAIVETVLPLIQEAVEADNYEVAIALGNVAKKAALESKIVTLVADVVKTNQKVLDVQKSFARVQAYIDRVQKNPKDAEANLELGTYYSLLKGRWEKGLPYLARGGDKTLAKLAAEDLEHPKEAHQQLALGDAWWNVSDSEKDTIKMALKLRAKHWYEKSMGKLSGLNQTKARKRIDTINSLLVGAVETPTGPMTELKKLLGHADDVKSVAFSPEGRYGVSGSSDSTVRVWDLVSGKEEKVLRGHTKQVWAVAFHLSPRQVMSASWDATVRLWDVINGTEIRRFSHRIDVNGLALSRDGNSMLTASDDHNVYLWNVQNGDEIRRFTGHTNFVYCVAFAPDGRHIASGGVDKSVRVFELATGASVRVFEGQTDAVYNVTFAPDSRSVYSCGDGAAHQWDLGTGKEVRRFEHKSKTGLSAAVKALALSPDGRKLYTGGEDKIIRIWDTISGKELQQLEGHTDTVNSLALSPDGHRLLSGSLDRSVRLWGPAGR